MNVCHVMCCGKIGIFYLMLTNNLRLMRDVGGEEASSCGSLCGNEVDREG